MTDHPAAPDADGDDLQPERLLALIDDETRGLKRALAVQVPVYYFVWGGAWLLGYLLLWSAWPGSTSPVVVPGWLAIPAFAVLILGAGVSSAVVCSLCHRGREVVSA